MSEYVNAAVVALLIILFFAGAFYRDHLRELRIKRMQEEIDRLRGATREGR